MDSTKPYLTRRPAVAILSMLRRCRRKLYNWQTWKKKRNLLLIARVREVMILMRISMEIMKMDKKDNYTNT